jgi:hypothetical protein
MFARFAFVLAAVACASAGAGAADNPSAYDCEFTSGSTHVYDKGRFGSEPAARLKFGISTINAPQQTAELKTSSGTGVLRLVLAVNATHFIEVATEGALNITTVYDKDDAKDAFPAVHSRHFALLGQPVVTQYQGFCRGKD